jgi:hypothetical protein
MPYIAHTGVPSPDDLETPLWRYLDLPKFLSLVVSGELYFSQLAKLGDPHEGTVTQKNYESELLSYLRVSRIHPGAHPTPEQMRDQRLTMREHTFVACWHQNPVESASMWRSYAPSGFGVVIESKFERLKRVFDGFPGLGYVGKVSYIDRDRDMIDRSSLFHPILTKRNNFDQEREVRAFLFERDGPIARSSRDYVEGTCDGVSIPICLEDLAISLRVSPRSAPWFRDVISNLLVRFGHAEIPALPSELDAAPLY